MNLILQAIAALFRKAENAIAQVEENVQRMDEKYLPEPDLWIHFNDNLENAVVKCGSHEKVWAKMVKDGEVKIRVTAAYDGWHESLDVITVQVPDDASEQMWITFCRGSDYYWMSINSDGTVGFD